MSSRATSIPTPLAAWRDVATSGLEESERLRARVAAQPEAPDVELWLVRHGETTTNAAGLVTGTTDTPLSVRGRLQAQSAGRAIAGHAFDLGFASNLSRSRETLELMTRAGGLAVAHTAQDARLAERSLGELERTPIRPRDPRLAVDLALAPAGGESYLALTRRSLSFLLDLRDLAARLDRPLAVLVCTHQGPLRVLVAILDAAAVRGRAFENGAVLRRSLRRIAWPAFAGRGAPDGETG
ncbi:MAG: 2,3-bisphosphoglycerate-dependent phosphoglycerate mutase [Solirubrobacteraceae bacterium]|nr:2,3-bisphosphoglycerate-dependent phosphoglycerate mutase [Solirubrobacteraceae bacterium]